jgi:ribosomal protein L37AE/L43A
MSTAASTGSGHSGRQAIAYCPYCSEETLFPLEAGGWECRSCLRAFSVTFLGLVSGRRAETEAS